MSELKITNCELCFNKLENNSQDNYTIGYYCKLADSKMICGECVDARSNPQKTLSNKGNAS